MTFGAIILGVINIAIVIAVLVLIGALVAMVAQWFDWPIPWNVRRLYMLVVMLIALYMLVALLFGLPLPLRVIGERY